MLVKVISYIYGFNMWPYMPHAALIAVEACSYLQSSEE